MGALARNISYPELAQKLEYRERSRHRNCHRTDGRILETEVIKGVPNTGLDEAAIEALMNTFQTGDANGQTGKVSMPIPITFRLKG